jgi:hypothetical protein
VPRRSPCLCRACTASMDTSACRRTEPAGLDSSLHGCRRVTVQMLSAPGKG